MMKGLQQLTGYYADMQDKLSFLRTFNRSTYCTCYAKREGISRYRKESCSTNYQMDYSALIESIINVSMKKCVRVMLCVIVGLTMPNIVIAQGGFADEIKSLHEVLEQLYDEMLPFAAS